VAHGGSANIRRLTIVFLLASDGKRLVKKWFFEGAEHWM
jgi:hypothetical protein